MMAKIKWNSNFGAMKIDKNILISEFTENSIQMKTQILVTKFSSQSPTVQRKEMASRHPYVKNRGYHVGRDKEII
jgi:hypothetical protein